MKQPTNQQTPLPWPSFRLRATQARLPVSVTVVCTQPLMAAVPPDCLTVGSLTSRRLSPPPPPLQPPPPPTQAKVPASTAGGPGYAPRRVILELWLSSGDPVRYLAYGLVRLVGPVSWLVGWLTSQQHPNVSQGRICSDNFTCCNTQIEVADPTFHLTQSQYTDTGPTSPSTDPITPGAWQGSHWSVNFLSLWYDSTSEKSRLKRESNPGSSAPEADALTTRPTRRLVGPVSVCCNPGATATLICKLCPSKLSQADSSLRLML